MVELSHSAEGLHRIRVTGVLIENEKMLLVRQWVSPDRNWSLPGGRVEKGESLEAAIIREMWEETGLRVSVKRLLYVAEKPEDMLLHITFELRREGGSLQLPINELENHPISDIEYVAIDRLKEYGFSEKWQDLAAKSFLNAPDYVGHKRNIGL